MAVVQSLNPEVIIKPKSLEETLNETADTMGTILDVLEDEILEEEVEVEAEDTPLNPKEKEAMSFLEQFQAYIKSDKFKNDVKETSRQYGVPPKKLAQGFFEKALGTVGDILGVAISVICNAGHMVIQIVSTIAHAVVDLIRSIFNGIASIVTLNKTCTQ